jgi:hypothetical protein
MAGRAQAANLTGMLGQLAETVGEMGKASDWTHQNIRDYSAPKIDTNDPASLQAYAEYSQRNGNPQDAQKYSQMATDLGVKQKAAKATGTLANLQASASNMNRLLSDPSLTAQNRATIQANLDVVLTEMNTVGANNAMNGGTGLEGEAHRKAMKKQGDDDTLTQLKIDERRQVVGEALSKDNPLHQGLFPDTPHGKSMWEHYSAKLATMTDPQPGDIARFNGTYSGFLTTAITDAVKAADLTHKATYEREESQFDSDMQGLYAKRNSAETKEEQAEIDAAIAAREAQAETTFGLPEYATMNNTSVASRSASAAASVTAAADKGIAREQAQSTLRRSLIGEKADKLGLDETAINIEIAQKTNRLKTIGIDAAQVALATAQEDLTLTQINVLQKTAEYGDFIDSGTKMGREMFLTDKDYQGYSMGYDAAGPEGKRNYNKNASTKALVNKKVQSIEASKMLPGLNREVMTSLNKLAEKHPDLAAAIEKSVGDDSDVTNFAGENVLTTIASMVEDGNLIATYEGLPEPERARMVDQAVMDYLQQYQPSLYRDMRATQEDKGTGVTGTQATRARAEAKDERRDRIIGPEKAMGTGSYYLKALAAAQEKHGKYFDKGEFDAAYEAQVIGPLTGPQDEKDIQSFIVGPM